MQKTNMQEAIDFWEKHQPDSALEVFEIGRQEGYI